MKFWILVILCLCGISLSQAQIVSIDPPLFTLDEKISVIYDATQGSAGLVGISPVYTHTGVITARGGPGNWQRVQGIWGTADPNVVMAPIGNNLHLIEFVPREYYGIPENEEVVQLAFVFRNQDGSREGKTSALGDIFIDVPDQESFNGKFITPDEDQIVLQLNEELSISAAISMEATYRLYDNDQEILSGTGTEILFDYIAAEPGNHIIKFEASNGTETIEDSFSIVILEGQTQTADIPFDVGYGATIQDDGSVVLRLHAPNKEHVFALTDLSDFRIDATYQMTQTTDGEDWWIQLDEMADRSELLYQYLVDGNIKVADPYSSLILDDVNDSSISRILNSVPTPYPTGLTSGHISYVDLAPEEYVWENKDFTPPANEDLVIYELLMRDFLNDHSFDSLTDTLSYLSSLGVNAIELMPVSEFENNDSWGYNPSYHMALDKYYGNPESFKQFVDAAHGYGIAVILDIVYNHAFGQSPLVRLYWDSANSRPSENSPYFNQTARHPFNVGFDFNHDKQATQTYTKQTIDYWLDEFNVDGFRFDLSKGFTQKFSTADGAFSAFDVQRIARLSDYGNHIWERYPESILILEHFATSTEEIELAENGFLLWGNANFNSNEASMGWNTGTGSDFSHVYHQQRGFNNANLIGYMESHDEERLMYKNINFGNRSGSYSTQNRSIALQRNAMTTSFFMAIPGPKLMWQFGELGYDFSINRCTNGSINENCRLARKPIQWNYINDPNRIALFQLYQQIFKLKATHPAIDENADVTLNLQGITKSIISSHENEHLFLIGNFDVVPQDITVEIPAAGTWHNYLLGTTITTSSANYSTRLAPGEYHIFVNNEDFVTSSQDLFFNDNPIVLYPNPIINQFAISGNDIGAIDILLYSADGSLQAQHQNIRTDELVDVSALRPGVYFVQLVKDLVTIGTNTIVIAR